MGLSREEREVIEGEIRKLEEKIFRGYIEPLCKELYSVDNSPLPNLNMSERISEDELDDVGGAYWPFLNTVHIAATPVHFLKNKFAYANVVLMLAHELIHYLFNPPFKGQETEKPLRRKQIEQTLAELGGLIIVSHEKILNREEICEVIAKYFSKYAKNRDWGWDWEEVYLPLLGGTTYFLGMLDRPSEENWGLFKKTMKLANANKIYIKREYMEKGIEKIKTLLGENLTNEVLNDLICYLKTIYEEYLFYLYSQQVKNKNFSF
jgi:hypothetical protein